MTIDEFNTLEKKRNRGKYASSEHNLQVGCVNWFRLVYKQYAKLLMAIPNGGYRTRTTAKLMRAEGQLAGVPDLFLAVAKNGYHGLWIEMKNGKAGRLSEKQSEMIARLANEGYACAVCYDKDEFINTIHKYLG